MTRLSGPHVVYVEGQTDANILSQWFPNLTFKNADGEKNVRKEVGRSPKSWGLIDRDFDTPSELSLAQNDVSRVSILERYCIENYLLEPEPISIVARKYEERSPKLSNWTNVGFVRQKFFEWAEELAIYAAANATIFQWRRIIEDDFLKYFGPLPPLPHDEVLSILKSRLEQLPTSAAMDQSLSEKLNQINQDIVTWDGMHRWINGKVLLEEVLYQRVFNLHNLGQRRLRNDLIEAGRKHIPDELVQLAEKWET